MTRVEQKLAAGVCDVGAQSSNIAGSNVGTLSVNSRISERPGALSYGANNLSMAPENREVVLHLNCKNRYSP